VLASADALQSAIAEASTIAESLMSFIVRLADRGH
jgi:hypothetical protein